MSQAENAELAERRPEDWVMHRAGCTIAKKFNDLIEAVESDVKKFNDLEDEDRQWRPKVCTSRRENYFCVKHSAMEGDHGQKPSVGFKLVIDDVTKAPSLIHVNEWIGKEKEDLFTINAVWNEDDLDCDLKIDGKVYSIWQISQKAIIRLLFGKD